MIDNFARGGAAINVLTRRFGAELVVVNVGSNAKKLPPSVIDLRVRPGTANWLPARLTVGPMLLAFRILGWIRAALGESFDGTAASIRVPTAGSPSR